MVSVEVLKADLLAAALYEAGGRPEAADRLRTETAVLERYLATSGSTPSPGDGK